MEFLLSLAMLLALFFLLWGPVVSILLSFYLARKLCYRMNALPLWLIILMANMMFLTPVAMGTEGFGFFIPWPMSAIFGLENIYIFPELIIVAAIFFAIVSSIAIWRTPDDEGVSNSKRLKV